MNLIIKKNILLTNLNNVSKALSNKTLIPVYSGIKMDLRQTGLYLTCTNDDITIESIIYKKEIEEIKETGNIIIPGRFFVEIVKKIPEDLIKIKTDGLKIIIKTENAEYNLNGISVTDFPNRKFEYNDVPLILDKNTLKKIIEQTSFAVSTQELRPILTGINLKIKDKKMECTATDSYRLSKKKILLDEKQKDEKNITIPGKNMIELSKIIEESEEKIELHLFSTNVLFKFENILFQSRLLNGVYPETSKLFDFEEYLTIKINKDEFYNVLDRASLLTNEKEKNIVKMDILKNKIKISSLSQEIGKIEETMKIERNNDKDLSISFSSKYMMDCLKAFDREIIELNLLSEIKPIIIKEENNDDLVQLVLPIKTF